MSFRQYLREEHPEIFYAIPRPGGIASISTTETVEPRPRGSSVVDARNSIKSERFGLFDPKFLSSIVDYECRDRRIEKALESPAFTQRRDAEAYQQKTSTFYDTIDILAIVVTTILLMTADYKDISKNHFTWTLSYLSCIKDECGRTPPNVRGIINHIKMLDPNIDSLIATGSTDTEDMPENQIKVTTANSQATNQPSSTNPPSPTDQQPEQNQQPEPNPEAETEEGPTAELNIQSKSFEAN